MLCTFTPGNSACTGDLGGPLVTFDPIDQALVLIGVASWGKGCAEGFPGVYAKISHFKALEWIEKEIGKSNGKACPKPKPK